MKAITATCLTHNSSHACQLSPWRDSAPACRLCQFHVGLSMFHKGVRRLNHNVAESLAKLRRLWCLILLRGRLSRTGLYLETKRQRKTKK